MCNGNAEKETVCVRRKIPRDGTEREVHPNIWVRRIENTYILYTKVSRTQAKRGNYIYLSSGAHDDTVLIKTFEKKRKL